MRKFLLFAALALVAAGGAAYYFLRNGEAPSVPFARAAVQTISSTIATNGKAEPVSYSELHADTPGLVQEVLVRAGSTVAKGQTILTLGQPGLPDELSAAQAREAETQVALDSLSVGGHSAELAEMDANLNRLHGQREAAQKRLESTERLLQKQAATPFDRDEAITAIRDLDAQMQTISARRSALVSQSDVAAANARLREAKAGVALIQTRMGQSAVRSPIGGVVYSLPAQTGAYLAPGAPIASIGILDPARVRVYIDEPELGRVKTGQPVRITWDALPARDWTGTVEKLPTEIVALGSRQVGEVLCTVRNPSNELLPGTNVNVFLLTEVVDNAVTIPRTAVHRDNGTGVYLLGSDNTIRWREIKTGASDALNIQALSGLQPGDAVAQPSDHPLKSGEKVTPVIQPGK